MSDRCDFVSRRWATDCGPRCTCDPSMMGLWVYLDTGEGWFDDRAWCFVGQCASCHRIIEFPVPFTGTDEPTIQQVKSAHWTWTDTHKL